MRNFQGITCVSLSLISLKNISEEKIHELNTLIGTSDDSYS